jgi:hypothetical protein
VTSAELVDWHAGTLALDVPQRHIHGGEYIVVHRAIAPVGAHLCRLPQVFDPGGVFSDQPGFQMFFQCGHHCHGLVVVVGGPDAIQSGLAGDDLEEDPTVVAAPVGGDDLAVLDGEWWQTIGPVGNFLCAGDREQWKRGSG